MYTMKQACEQVDMNYETLKFYCNEGLVPNVKRDSRNYRMFDDRDIAWIKSLSCLKRCGMSISEMKQYVDLCLKGETSIPERQTILAEKRISLLKKMQEVKECIEYIDSKQQFYQNVLEGSIPYVSNLILSDKNEQV